MCNLSVRRGLIFLFAAATSCVAAPETSDPWQAERGLFLDAENAFRRGDHARYRHLAAELSAYPLYPYLRYNRLSRAIGPKSYAEIERFIDQYPDTPLAERLRSRWLDDLATRGDWNRYLAVYRPTTHTARRCHFHYAQLRQDEREKAFTGARELWLHGKSQPQACDRLFTAWHHSDDFQAGDASARLALAMAAGEWQLARYLKRFLPAAEQNAAEQWIRLYRSPSLLRECSNRQELLRSATPQALAHGLQRLARRDPPGALTAFREIASEIDFSDAQQHAVISDIIRRYAWRDLPGTGELLGDIPAALLDATAREARMRWALSVGQLHRLPSWFYDLPETDQESTRWRFWRALAWEQEGKAHEAELALRELARERDYYGFLAADRVGADYSFNHRPLDPDAETLAALRESGFVARAAELRRLDRRTAARQEWWHGLRDADDRTMDAAIVVASELGWHRIAVLTASQARRWDDVERRFPVAYDEEISSHASAQSLPEEILMSLARRESAFDRFARSGAGARGLLQIMPATGQEIARDLGDKWNSTWALYDAETSLKYGSHYLAKQLHKFDGQLPLALAAYNGGPHNVARWLRFDGTMEAAQWIETIGFKETREYVQAILAYAMIYRAHLGLPAQRLSHYLKPVTGSGTTSATAPTPAACNR